MWCRYSTEIGSDDFEAVRQALADLLDTPGDALEAGVSETLLVDGFIALALDPANKFLAARWLKQGHCGELFFVRPATKPARLGFSALSAGADIPQSLRRWLSSDHQVDKLPSFTTFSSLLASQGAAVRDINLHERQLASDNEYLKQLLAEQSDLLRQTQAQLREARLQFAQVPADSLAGIAETPATWSLDELSEWCAEHEGQVVVLPRARNGAKKSIYEDPALIGTALEILAGPYRELRLGQMSTEDFEAILLPTGLRLSGSVSPMIAGEQGDAYFVSWAGRRRFLEFHLLKGGGRDERYCFRLYFFWDSESSRAIVGSMPAHLSNSLS